MAPNNDMAETSAVVRHKIAAGVDVTVRSQASPGRPIPLPTHIFVGFSVGRSPL
jgi:hypothetical protein